MHDTVGNRFSVVKENYVIFVFFKYSSKASGPFNVLAFTTRLVFYFLLFVIFALGSIPFLYVIDLVAPLKPEIFDNIYV